jgi:hypothetical protein
MHGATAVQHISFPPVDLQTEQKHHILPIFKMSLVLLA